MVHCLETMAKQNDLASKRRDEPEPRPVRWYKRNGFVMGLAEDGDGIVLNPKTRQTWITEDTQHYLENIASLNSVLDCLCKWPRGQREAARFAGVSITQLPGGVWMINSQGSLKDRVESLTGGEVFFYDGKAKGLPDVKAGFVVMSAMNFRDTIKERDGWKLEAESLKERLCQTTDELIAINKAAKHDVWYYQGDGTDHPESLTCNVVMSADQFRELVSKKATDRTPFQKGDVIRCLRRSPERDKQGELHENSICMAGKDYTTDGCFFSPGFGWLVSISGELHDATDFCSFSADGKVVDPIPKVGDWVMISSGEVFKIQTSARGLFFGRLKNGTLIGVTSKQVRIVNRVIHPWTMEEACLALTEHGMEIGHPVGRFDKVCGIQKDGLAGHYGFLSFKQLTSRVLRSGEPCGRVEFVPVDE